MISPSGRKHSKSFRADRRDFAGWSNSSNSILDRNSAFRRHSAAKPVRHRTKAKPPRPSRPAERARRTAAVATTGEIAPLSPPLPQIAIDIPLTIEFDLAPLLSRHGARPEQDGRWFGLRERFAHLGLAQGFDELLCLPHLAGVEPLWHQIETVRKVLKQFRGRVLLADEVGLGKTIEAGMVLKEYALRGMAERTWCSRRLRWSANGAKSWRPNSARLRDHLRRAAARGAACVLGQDRIVASIATARRREHAERLRRAHNFDLIIVDEAHHLRDRSSQSWKLVDSLNKRFLLLLSATPVQNDLVELYNLLTLLKPGIFKTLKEFRLAYMTPGKPRQPANSERLRGLMRGAMIRNTRAVVALKLPRRHATTIKVDGAPGEAEAYADARSGGAATRRRAAAKRERLSLQHLLSAAGSSPRAAATALAAIAARHPAIPSLG